MAFSKRAMQVTAAVASNREHVPAPFSSENAAQSEGSAERVLTDERRRTQERLRKTEEDRRIQAEELDTCRKQRNIETERSEEQQQSRTGRSRAAFSQQLEKRGFGASAGGCKAEFAWKAKAEVAGLGAEQNGRDFGSRGSGEVSQEDLSLKIPGERPGFGQRPISSASGRTTVSMNSAATPTSERKDLPSRDQCESAIQAMCSRTGSGMKEGLRHLGLPDFPLTFKPMKELKLCGHDVREDINEMIYHWFNDEMEEFYGCYLRVKSNVVDDPILGEEDFQMLQRQEEWELIPGSSDRLYRRRKPGPLAPVSPVEDDTDDEVLDVPPVGQPSVDDHYALLGVAPTSTLHEIRVRFRQLVIAEHPEKGGDPKKFQRLNKAYSVLSDHEKRRNFDEVRRAAGL